MVWFDIFRDDACLPLCVRCACYHIYIKPKNETTIPDLYIIIRHTAPYILTTSCQNFKTITKQ